MSDATQNKQILHIKSTESLLAHSGNISKKEILEKMKKDWEDYQLKKKEEKNNKLEL